MIKYGQFTIYATCIILLFSCSPSYRFKKLIKKHPELLETITSDTVVIDKGKTIDTIIVVKNQKDTFYIKGGVRVERFGDTFRFYYRERNCTTFIQTVAPPLPEPKKRQQRQIPKEEVTDLRINKASLYLYILALLLLVGFIRKIFSYSK